MTHWKRCGTIWSDCYAASEMRAMRRLDERCVLSDVVKMQFTGASRSSPTLTPPPARAGTEETPQEYVDEWTALPVGVDRKAPLADFYPAEVLDVLRTGPEAFDRWGIVQGQGDLVGAILGELPVPRAVAALAGGETDAQTAASDAAEKVRSIQETLP